MILQLLQVMLLARILSPADFGLVAIVISLMAIIQIFADAGVSNAIVHYQDITLRELDSLYWLNVGVSLLLAAALLLASSAIARWYGQPMLRTLLAVAAFTLIANALGQQLRIMAQKQLRFAELAKAELGGAFAGAVIAIALASRGAGAVSLVSGSCATASATSLLAWYLLANGWRPQLRLRWSDVRRFVRFGAYLIGNNLANTLNSQVDVLLGARLFGASSIGLYSVPKDLSLRLAGIINPIVTEVSLPFMASAQEDVPLLRRMYLQMIRMTSSVSFPAYVGLALFAPDIVSVALGPGWAGTVPLLRILACWALLRSIGNPVGTMLMALGRPGLSFAWNVGLLVVMPPALWLGSRYGLQGMAFAMTGLALLVYLPNWLLLVNPLCGAKLGEYTLQVAIPLAVSLAAGLASFAVVSYIEVALLRLVVGWAAGTAIYFLLSWRFNRTWFTAMLELAGRQTYAG